MIALDFREAQEPTPTLLELVLLGVTSLTSCEMPPFPFTVVRGSKYIQDTSVADRVSWRSCSKAGCALPGPCWERQAWASESGTVKTEGDPHWGLWSTAVFSSVQDPCRLLAQAAVCLPFNSSRVSCPVFAGAVLT